MPKSPVMSPKGTRCFLLLISAACSWLPCEGTSYNDFLKLHMDFPKSNLGNDDAYCQEMMNSRGLTCWRSNVFLHANEAEQWSLCSSRGHFGAEMVSSPTPLPITVCSRKRGTPRKICSYEGKSVNRTIWVTCLKGLPVYFNKDW